MDYRKYGAYRGQTTRTLLEHRRELLTRCKALEGALRQIVNTHVCLHCQAYETARAALDA